MMVSKKLRLLDVTSKLSKSCTTTASSRAKRGLACYKSHAWCVGAAQTLKRKGGNLGLTKVAPRYFRS